MTSFLKSRWKFLGMMAIAIVLSLGLALIPNGTMIAQEGVGARPFSWLDQGAELYQAERFGEAAQAWQKAISTETNDRTRAVAASNLALTYHQLGRWTEADRAIAQSITFLQGDQTSLTAAQVMDIQGTLAFDRGHHQTALDHWKRASQIYQHLNEPSRLRTNYLNQARAMQLLGQLNNAEKLLEELQTRLADQSNPTLKQQELQSLVQVYVQGGKLEQARKVIEPAIAHSSDPSQQALWQLEQANLQRAIAQRARDLESAQTYGIPVSCPVFQADALPVIDGQPNAYQLASTALATYRGIEIDRHPQTEALQLVLNRYTLSQELGKSESGAEPSTAKALIAKSPVNRSTIFAQIALARSRLCSAQEDFSAIVPDLEQAIQHAKDIQDTRALSYATGTLGHLYERMAQKKPDFWDKAGTLTKTALQQANYGNFADIAYQWEWQQGRILATQNHKSAAIAAYQSAVNTLKTVRHQLLGSDPNTQFSFRDQAEPMYRELIGLLLDSSTEVSPDRLSQAIRLVDALQVAELENFFRCITGQLVPIESVIQTVNQSDQKAALIYPIILSNRLELIAKLPNQTTPIHRTIALPQATLDTTTEQLLDVLRSQDASVSEVQTPARQLYDWLIRPILPKLQAQQIKTLVFILDGSLREIPMSALWDGQQYLIEKYAVAITPSLELLGPKPLRNLNAKALLAGLTVDPLPPVTLPDGQKKRLEPLVTVQDELNQIKSILPSSVDLKGKEFQTHNLRDRLAQQEFPIVHLSTHGEFSSNSQRTYIATASGEPITIEGLRELLRVGKQGRSGALELLVFSACQTAQGDRRASLGLAGVAVRSGASSTVATLWSVDEQSTTELMTEFYRNLKQAIAQNKTKAQALQQAQRAILEKGRREPASEYDRPYFWAPFILVGNWL